MPHDCMYYNISSPYELYHFAPPPPVLHPLSLHVVALAPCGVLPHLRGHLSSVED